jgi:hypothetical protein
MSKPVRGIKVTFQQLVDSDPPDSMFSDFVVPVRYTILSRSYGTVVETAEGALYLVPVGDWFRSDYCGKGMDQVSDFNKLQDYGLTAIKDAVVRNEEKEDLGQEIRSEDNVSVEKADEAVATNPKRKKKDQDRSGTP